LLRIGEERKEVNGMSNPESMQQLADKFMNDESFREEMRRDPEGAAERSGYQLDEEDRQALRSIDWSGSDEELKERVSKAWSWC
jgi:hypothetical protein